MLYVMHLVHKENQYILQIFILSRMQILMRLNHLDANNTIVSTSTNDLL